MVFTRQVGNVLMTVGPAMDCLRAWCGSAIPAVRPGQRLPEVGDEVGSEEHQIMVRLPVLPMGLLVFH